MKAPIRGARLRLFTLERPHAEGGDMLIHGSAIEAVAAAGSIADAANITVIGARNQPAMTWPTSALLIPG